MDNFLDSFGLEEAKNSWKALISIYFAFTSLSTVGFGDFYPTSDMERLFGAFVMMFGVAIFSMFMNIFIGILESYQSLNRDLDCGDDLARFFWNYEEVQ
jgi:O-antigen/teichoic acid export membrane protein